MAARRGSTNQELSVAMGGVFTGMFISNLVMFFIVLTTAATLHAHAVKEIETAKQASEALRPLVTGKGAYWLFTLGLIGTGMLGVPVLAGSCTYAIAEAASWREASLSKKTRLAARFYMVIAGAMVVGLALNFAGLNAVKMLFWSVVVNGVLAPPLVVLVVLLTSDKKGNGPPGEHAGSKGVGMDLRGGDERGGFGAGGYVTSFSAFRRSTGRLRTKSSPRSRSETPFPDAEFQYRRTSRQPCSLPVHCAEWEPPGKQCPESAPQSQSKTKLSFFLSVSVATGTAVITPQCAGKSANLVRFILLTRGFDTCQDRQAK